MKTLRLAALAALAVGLASSSIPRVVYASELPAVADDGDEDDDLDGETITPNATKTVVRGGAKKEGVARPKPIEREDGGISIEEAKARPYPSQVYLGAEALELEPEFVGGAWLAIEELYKRDYKSAKNAFDELEVAWPGRAVGHVGGVLVYQGLMMENFDFKYEKQYQFHYEGAVRQLEAAVDEPGREAWEHFLLGAMKGVEAIHVMRREEFVSAITRGLDAIKHIEQVKELAPNFHDPRLGDGLYKYWRSVVTMQYKALPDYGDQRSDGINDMQVAETNATFLRPGASLALAFTYIEERDMKRALGYCLRNNRLYPENVINNLVLARVYLYMRKYDNSLRVLEQVRTDAPENERARYYLATVYMRKGELDKAEGEIDAYLGFQLEDYYRAQALHRKGDVYWRRKDYDQAETLYKEAVRLDGYKASKAKLAKLKKMKKEGRI